MENRDRKNRLIIYYAIILQLITGLFILFSPVAIRVARLGIFYDIFPSIQIGALLMIASAITALVGLFRVDRYRFLFFIPQYLFLLLTAGSALSQTIMGEYADGVVRHWSFIFIDQLPSLITATLYMFGIFDFKKKEVTNGT